jgi:Prokaryotic RING finger family 4
VTTTARETRTDPLVKVLLRRSGLVAPGLLTGTKVKDRGQRSVATAQGLVALEADVLALGYLVGPRLRAYLSEQDPQRLGQIGLALYAALAEVVGGDVPHVPLFRDFPRRIPADTQELYVRRVFALLLQEPSQPCVLCGVRGLVHTVSPCAHLVCENCWDMGNYSGCPICHGRCDSFFLSLVPDMPVTDPKVPLPRRAAVLEIADPLHDAIYSTVVKLLERRTPLSPQDRDDLAVMLDFAGHADLHWLPAEIPVRETRALVLARLVADPALRDRVPGLLDTQVTTATDLLRLLYVLQGGDAGLVTRPPRRLSVRRSLRRVVLARLDALAFPAVVEDLHRHRTAWLGMAETLHPFEHTASFPRAATAFAALRRTVIDETTPFGRVVVATAGKHPSIVHLDRSRWRLRVTAPVSRVESALERGDLEPALRVLASRPGELARRLVALAYRTRAGGDADLMAALKVSVAEVSPAVLIAAIGALRAASWPAGARLFLPRGGAALMWTQPDRRPRLDAGLAVELESVLTAEMLRRAQNLAPVPVATLDAGLADLMVPFGERTASASLVRLARGSHQPLPQGRVIRLFLHWTQPETIRVDLDLSIAIYDETGAFVGWCDYTRLRFGDKAAVHSGDLTSAPAPVGASEFVDLNVAELRRRGIRYVTMVVFSYNDVPFDSMTDAFAGFMGDPGRGGPFDAKAVEQRFDLTGNVKVAVPLVIDIEQGRMRWLDAKLGSSGHGHNVNRNTKTLGRLAVATADYFEGGRRVTMWELACWHAAARAALVQVRHADGSVAQYLRETGEPVEAFAARIVAQAPPDDLVTERVEPAHLAVLVRGDADIVAGGQVQALYRAALDADRVELLDAADLVGLLA